MANREFNNLLIAYLLDAGKAKKVGQELVDQVHTLIDELESLMERYELLLDITKRCLIDNANTDEIYVDEDEDEYYKLSSDYYISVEDYEWIKEELNELEESEDE